MAKLVTLHDADGEVIYPQTISDMDYSTSEQDTGCKWIDGKKIYRKTYVVSLPSSGSSMSVNHGISNLSSYIKSEGVAVFSNGMTTRFLPCFYIGSDGSFSNQYYCSIYGGATDKQNFTLNFGSAYLDGTAYVTLYYTKTTS